MNHRRDQLIAQVKTAYSSLADWESRSDFVNKSDVKEDPESYYEHQLESAIAEIQSGKYDAAPADFNIVEHLANQKSKANRIKDSIDATRHKMEVAEELMAYAPNKGAARELKEDNARRADAIVTFSRDLKEARAEEELGS